MNPTLQKAYARELRSRAEAAGNRLPPLLVAAERVAATVEQGVHGRKRVGTGDSFWQYRRYQPGDAVNQVDWRRSARSDRLYVRQNEWEAAESVWLWRDASPSMHFRSQGNLDSKHECANLLCMAIAILLAQGGERLTLLSRRQPPQSGDGALRWLVNALTSPHRFDQEELPLRQELPRYAQVVIISDFLSPLEDIAALLRSFAVQEIQGHLVHLYDPAEASFPFEGRVRFTSMEGDRLRVLDKVEDLRADYQANFRNHVTDLGTLARQYGWSLLSHNTATPPETALLALYQHMAGERGLLMTGRG